MARPRRSTGAGRTRTYQEGSPFFRRHVTLFDRMHQHYPSELSGPAGRDHTGWTRPCARGDAARGRGIIRGRRPEQSGRAGLSACHPTTHVGLPAPRARERLDRPHASPGNVRGRSGARSASPRTAGFGARTLARRVRPGRRRRQGARIGGIQGHIYCCVRPRYCRRGGRPGRASGAGPTRVAFC